MRGKASAALSLTALAVLLDASPAFAASSESQPRGDNSPWVAVVFAIAVLGVAGFLLFLANAYRKNNNRS